MMLIREIKDFCLNTYVHGFRFIVLPKRELFERILWLIITGVAIGTSIALSWISWIKMTKRPTLTLTDAPNYAIWNYLFPAVTICNFNIISKSRAYQFANNIKRPDNTTVDQLAWDLRLLYYLVDFTSYSDIRKEKFTKLQDILDNNNVLVDELMEYLAPDCNEMLERCTWKGQQIPCSRLFEPIKTAEGYCCSFNFFGQKNHTFKGTKQFLASNYKIPDKPRRVSATGYQTALEAVINSLPEDYFATPFASFGYRVVVHHPYSFPDGNALNIVQTINSVIFIGVKPFLYRTDMKVDEMHTSQRKCIFQKERQLFNFRYSYYNCISECRLNITKELCNCTPFYYYYKNHSNGLDNKICNLLDISCLAENTDNIRSSIPGQKYHLHLKHFKSDWLQHNTKCSCLPDCTYSTYSIEASAGQFNKEYAANKPTLYGGVKFKNQSVVRVFFDDLVSTRYTTTVRFYWHTLLGFFGGILGIFTGFSIVSLVEIAYFFTIRPILDYMVEIKSNNRKHVQQDLKEERYK